MTLIRNEQQATLNELLKMTRQSADHFEDLADFFEQARVAEVFRACSSAREPVIGQLEAVVETLGDLPVEPSQDRITVEGLVQRIQSSVLDKGEAAALQTRIKAERELLQSAQDAQTLEWEAEGRQALSALVRHVQDTIQRLETALENSA